MGNCCDSEVPSYKDPLLANNNNNRNIVPSQPNLPPQGPTFSEKGIYRGGFGVIGYQIQGLQPPDLTLEKYPEAQVQSIQQTDPHHPNCCVPPPFISPISPLLLAVAFYRPIPIVYYPPLHIYPPVRVPPGGVPVHRPPVHHPPAFHHHHIGGIHHPVGGIHRPVGGIHAGGIHRASNVAHHPAAGGGLHFGGGRHGGAGG